MIYDLWLFYCVLDVINKCKDYKEGEENNLGIFSDLEVLADCTCKEVLDNLDHNDYW